MAVVDCVETNQSREQPQIGLGETVARKVAMTAEALLVSRLSLGEAAAIDAIVDRVVNKSIRFFDRTAQHRGVEVERRIAEFLEFRVQHANDFGGFSLLTIVRVSRSHKTGTVARPVKPGRAAL